MILEIATPASFPLGPVLFEENGQVRHALLLASLQHPPVQLSADKAAGFSITGPRAHIANQYARHFYDHHGLAPRDTIEIELAIPSLMGLGSDSLLGLGAARALAHLYALPEDVHSLSAAIGLSGAGRLQNPVFESGGLLVLAAKEEDGKGFEVLQRLEVSHMERDAWAFVFYFPHPPGDVDESEENSRLEFLLAVAASQPIAAETIQTSTFANLVEQDDIQGFGLQISTAHSAARRQSVESEAAGDAAPIFDIMRSEGALAWGQALSGYSLWCLVRGGDASRRVRKRVQDHVGFYGGRVMATVIDNRGANLVEKQGRLGIGPSMHPRRGVSSKLDE